MYNPNHVITLTPEQQRIAVLMVNNLDYGSRIAELNDTLTGLVSQVEEITEKAIAENRDLTPDEYKIHKDLTNQFKATKDEVTRLEEMEANATFMREPVGQPKARRQDVEPQNGRQPPRQRASFGGNDRDESKALFKNLATGELVNGYRGTASMFKDNAGLPLGDVLHGILLNDLSGLPADVRNAVSTGSDVSGGYLFQPALSQQVIDLARANMVCMKAGAISIPMPTGELQLARLDSDATVFSRGELGTGTASKPAFGRYSLKPKTIGAIVPVSIEMLEDVPNAGQVIETALINAIATETDRQMLEGTGASAEILGVVNNSGVNAQTSVGLPTTYGEVSTAVRDVLNSNFAGDVSDLAWVSNPMMGGIYDGLVSGITNDNTPLTPTPWVEALRRMYTTSLAVSGSDYNSIVGNFSEMMVGMRTSGVVIDVLDAGSVTDEDSESWNAVTDFMRFIRARIRVDMILMQPSHFSVMSGLNVS